MPTNSIYGANTMQSDTQKKTMLFALATSVSLSFYSLTMGDTLFVDCMGSGDYETLQDAVDNAVSGDTLKVLPCTYDVNNVLGSVDIHAKDLEIVGIDGREETTIEITGPFAIEISGGESPIVSLTGFTIQGNSEFGSSSAVIQRSGRLTIDECTLRNNGSSTENGGAIDAQSFDSLTINDTVFTNNEANNYGGAIYIDNGNSNALVQLSNTDFSGNNSSDIGGALYCKDASILIRNSAFSNNKTFDVAGAFYYKSTELSQAATLRNTSFTSNVADSDGGATYLDEGPGSATLIGCVFTSNWSRLAGTYGGALQIYGIETNVTDCKFSLNSADQSGAVDVYESSAHFTDCVFKKNTAFLQGGAIGTEDSQVSISNSKFVKNASDTYGLGGAIFALTSDIEMSNVRFIKNQATQGGAFYANLCPNTKLSNCVFKKNAADVESTSPDLKNAGGAIFLKDLSFNLKGLKVQRNRTALSAGGIYLSNATGKIGKCTIEDNEHHGLQITGDGSSVEIQKTTSCQNGSKDVKGSYTDNGDNSICKD